MYNNVNYAVVINTGTTITDENIGMYNGIIRFVTDRYVVTDDTYEDTTLVGNQLYWYKNFISKDGLSNAGSQINIEVGGDYAYLQGFDVKLVNMTPTGTPYHLTIGSEYMQQNGVYPIGSDIQMYVIIDKIWYARYGGIVTDTVIDDEYFKFVCEDKNIKEYKLLPQNVINSVNYPDALPSDNGKPLPRVYGSPLYSKLFVTTTLIKKYLEKSFTINRLKPNMFETSVDGSGRVSNINSPSTYTPASNYGNAIPPYMQQWYQTGNSNISDFKYVNLNNNYYAIVVGAPSTFDEQQLVGKFVSVTNKYNESLDKLTDLHLIKEVKVGSTDYTDSNNSKLIYLYVDKSPVKLIDNTCLYGNITNNPYYYDGSINPADQPAIMTMGYDTTSIAHAFIVNSNINGIVSDLPVVYSNTLPSDIWYQNAKYENSNVFLYKAVGDSVGVFKSEFVFNNNGVIECVSPFLTSNTPAHVLHKADYGKYFTYDSNKWADNFASRSIDSLNNIIFTPVAYTKEVTTGSIINPKKISSQQFNLTSEGQYGLCLNLTYSTGKNFQNYDSIEINYAFEFLDEIVYPQGAEHPLVNDGLDLISLGVHAESTDFLGNSVGSPYADVGKIPLPYSYVRFEDSNSNDGTWWFSNIAYNSRLIDVQAPQNGLQFDNMQYIINPLYKGSLYIDNNRIPLWTHAAELGEQDEYYYLDSQETNVNNSISTDIFSELNENGSLNTWVTIEPKSQNISNNVSSWQPSWSNLKIHYIGIGGMMEYKFSDLYLKAYDDTTSNLYTTIKNIIEDVNGITNVNYNNLELERSSWNVGRQIVDQKNSFDYIQELCNQSYVCGWTGRDGFINFSAYREYQDSIVTHDTTNIIKGSIKNLSKTPLSQVFNEMTFKYDWNAITNSFDGVYSISNVDSNSFPLITDVNPVWSDVVYDTTGKAFMYHLEDGISKVTISDINSDILTIINNDPTNIYKLVLPDYSEIICTNFVFESYNSYLDYSTYVIDIVQSTTLSGNYSVVSFNYNINENFEAWKTYVTGINSYPDAKDIWESCHQSWLESKTINLAPEGYTDLMWYVSSDDPTSDSAYKYMVDSVSYMTRQKWKINYQLAVTPDNVKLELMQRVNFSDPIYTGNGQMASGWITGYSLNPITDIIDIELTFEYFVAIPPVIMDQCVDIIETGNAITDIIETGSQPTNIIEGVCGR